MMDYSKGGFYNCHEWTDAELNEIAQIIHLESVSEKLRDDLNMLSKDYAVNRLICKDMTRPSQAKKTLRSMQERTQRLKSIIENIDSFTEQLLFMANPENKLLLFDQLSRDLLVLERAIQRAMALLPGDKGGRGSQAAIKALIPQLANLYRSATEKKATLTWDAHRNRYSGQFLKFCTTFFETINYSKDYHSVGSLALLIKRVSIPGC